MKVADVMTSPGHTCRASDPLAHAARLMWDYDLGCVPVVDAQGRASAMLTDRDICMAAYTRGQRLSEIPVQDAMSKEVYTCHVEDKLSSAERTMRVHQVRRLPVVDDAGRVIGVLSLNDICRAHTRSPLARAAEALVSDVAVTLAAIGRPRSEDSPSSESSHAADPSDVPNVPIQREKDTLRPSPRIPPPAIREPSSLFRF